MAASGRSQSSAKVFRRERKSAAWTSICGLDFINAAIMQYHRRIFGCDFHELPPHGLKFRRRQLAQFIDNLGYTHVFNLVCIGKIATANSIQYGSGNFAINSRTRS
jgi:hypothetical protein